MFARIGVKGEGGDGDGGGGCGRGRFILGLVFVGVCGYFLGISEHVISPYEAASCLSSLGAHPNTSPPYRPLSAC